MAGQSASGLEGKRADLDCAAARRTAAGQEESDGGLSGSGRWDGDLDAELVEARNQTPGELGLVATIAMVSAEVPVIDVVFKHVVCGREHRGRDRKNGLLRAPAALEAEELGAQVRISVIAISSIGGS